MYLKMRKVKSSKIYTQEWHRTRKVDPMEGIAKKMRCRWGGCCNDIRGWFSTGWIRIISSQRRQSFFFTSWKKIHDLLLIIIIISPPLYPKHIWVYCVYVALQQQQKKIPSFFQSRSNPSLFVTQKKTEKKEKAILVVKKNCEEESVRYTYKFTQAHMCVCVYETRMWYTLWFLVLCMHAREKKFKLAKSGDLTLYPSFFGIHIIPNVHDVLPEACLSEFLFWS